MQSRQVLLCCAGRLAALDSDYYRQALLYDKAESDTCLLLAWSDTCLLLATYLCTTISEKGIHDESKF